MPKSPVGADIHQSFDVSGNIPSEISFHLEFLFDNISDANHLGLGELVDLGVLINARLFENFIGRGSSNTKDIGEGEIGRAHV